MESIVLTNEVARMLGKSPQSVHWYADQGKLPAMRTSGGVRLFRKADVLKFAEKLRAKKQAKADARPDAS